MTKVFVLHHSYEPSDGAEEVKLIGVYSSEGAARAAISRLKGMPGFSSYPEGFQIDAYTLDQDHWREGFFRAGVDDDH